MTLTGNLLLNAYSMAVLAYIMVYSRMNTGKKDVAYRLFMSTVQVMFAMLLVDAFGRFDGRPGTLYEPLNRIGNFLNFILNPIVPSIWILYVIRQTGYSRKLMRLFQYLLGGLVFAQAAMTVASLRTGWYYRIGEDNIYHRGPLFLIPLLLPLVLILVAEGLIVFRRKRIARKNLFALLFFPVLPLLSILVSARVYGVSLVMNGTTLSILIVFFNIQTRSINTDYLTGLYNRQKLESVLRNRISGNIQRNPFTAILLDLDAFKQINDSYGHGVGDRALVASAELLQRCFRPDDVVARYGGDEFFVLFDAADDSVLREAVARIETAVEKANREHPQPYRIGFSMGYAMFDQTVHPDADTYLKRLDAMLYEEKRRKRKQGSAAADL